MRWNTKPYKMQGNLANKTEGLYDIIRYKLKLVNITTYEPNYFPSIIPNFLIPDSLKNK